MHSSVHSDLHRRRSARLGLLFQVLIAIAIVAATSAALFASPWSAGATHVAPGFVDGNPTCSDMIDDPDVIEFKIEPVPSGITTHSDGLLEVTINVYQDGEVFDWVSNIDVLGVVAKGGPNANFYDYRPNGEISDTGLQSPVHPQSGNIPGLSHISFCYLEPEFEPLEVEKTAEGSYDRTVEWELEKTVDPDSHTGNAGETAGTSTWTVEATKSEEVDNFLVEGTITITNPNDEAVSFSINDTLDDGTVADVTCPSTDDNTGTVGANSSIECDYVAVPNDSSAELNTAVVSSDHPDIDGDTATAPVTFTENLIGDDEVVVDDDRDTEEQFPQTISSSQTFTYDETFDCSSNPEDYENGSRTDIYPNTATLTGDNTDLSDDAEVTVVCTLPALEIDKDAAASFDREITWELEKSVDPASHEGEAGDEFESDWEIIATKNIGEAHNFVVEGTITVHNPAAIDQTIQQISDSIRKVGSDGGPHTVTEGEVTCDTLVVPAGGSIECTYIVEPNDDVADTNRARVKAEGNGVQFVDVPFEWQENLIGDEEVLLEDERLNIEETISETTTKEVSETFVCPADPEKYEDGELEFTEENLATLTGEHTDLEDKAEVDILCRIEILEVSKTVDTSFDLKHKWDIDKMVETEEGHELDDTPKIWLFTDGSGDETATWTVDVAYEGSEELNHTVSGTITIENTGGLDAVITDIDDVLGGVDIDVDCGEFDGTLSPGDTLTCTYDEDGKFEGDNVVTVTTERDEYDATEPIVWGDPDSEINRFVDVIDTNPGFADEHGAVKLDAHDYDEGDVESFSYSQDFAYEDYPECGSFAYVNTATIVETGQSASATLKVNVQCVDFETAFGFNDGLSECFIPDFNRWGWTTKLEEEETYTLKLYAGAAHCDLERGTFAGTVTVEYHEGFVHFDYELEDGFVLQETHSYAGETKYPQQKRGNGTVDTVAPGQYTNEGPFVDEIWVIAHAVVGIPDPNFGP